MTDPLYYLQLVTKDGTPITSPVRPLKRRHGTLELPLIEACEEAIVKRGVGLFRTEAQVRLAIREGMADAIHALKEEFTPLVKTR